MPIYRYKCIKCSNVKDEFRKIENRDDFPPCCGPMIRVITPTMITPDIEGYRAIAIDKETGKIPYISSRKQHREFLERNGYIEVGNQPFKPTPKVEDSTENDLLVDLNLSPEDL